MSNIIKWQGSKYYASYKILPILASCKRNIYVEPFGGSACMFFKKGKEPNEQEVYNDADKILVTLFRVLRSPTQREQLQFLLSITPVCREIFKEMRELIKAWQKDQDDFYKLKCLASLDSYSNQVVLAYAFFVVQNQGFGGKHYSTASFGGGGNLNNHSILIEWGNKQDMLEFVIKRFQNVMVECLDWRDCVKKYDRPNTLFYCDPPYVNTQCRYSSAFKENDLDELCKTLIRIKGSSALSCYPHPILDQLEEAGFIKESFRQNSTVNKDEPKPRTETLYYRFTES